MDKAIATQTAMASTAEAEAAYERLAHILQLNNKGASILAYSPVRSTEAVQFFQAALVAASALVELLGDAACGNDDEEEEGIEIGNNASGNSLCTSATAPLLIANGQQQQEELYFYQQVLFLHPEAPTPYSATTATSAPPSNAQLTRQLVRVYFPALLLNSALAYYQLGRACQDPQRRTRCFHKSCQLYDRIQALSVVNQSMTNSDAASSALSTTTAAMARFFDSCALNNSCFILLVELGRVEDAKARHADLVQSILPLRPANAGLSIEHQTVLQAIALNATVLTMTGFLQDLAAGAA